VALRCVDAGGEVGIVVEQVDEPVLTAQRKREVVGSRAGGATRA
jgi:hypothetical protein